MLTILHFQYELLNYFEFFFIKTKIKIEHYFSMILKKKATIINYKEFILHLPNHLNNILTHKIEEFLSFLKK